MSNDNENGENIAFIDCAMAHAHPGHIRDQIVCAAGSFANQYAVAYSHMIILSL